MSCWVWLSVPAIYGLALLARQVLWPGCASWQGRVVAVLEGLSVDELEGTVRTLVTRVEGSLTVVVSGDMGAEGRTILGLLARDLGFRLAAASDQGWPAPRTLIVRPGGFGARGPHGA